MGENIPVGFGTIALPIAQLALNGSHKVKESL
jgi:hypothetical protein